MVLPAENRGKVGNIVSAQKPQFVELYRRLLLGLPGLEWDENADVFRQDTSPAARALHLRKLPSTLLNAVETQLLTTRSDLPSKKTDESAYWAKLADNPELYDVIQTR
jgi:translocator assembly and maintenance protein 41